MCYIACLQNVKKNKINFDAIFEPDTIGLFYI